MASAALRDGTDIPVTEGDHDVTGHADLDTAVEELVANAPRWHEVGLNERIELLAEVRRATAAVADEWAVAMNRVKELEPGSPGYGESWLTGPYPSLRLMRLLQERLTTLRRNNKLVPSDVRSTSNGQVSARVYPSSVFDAILFPGYRIDVWMQPSVRPETVADTLAPIYCGKPGKPAVGLVLGAGNVSAICVADVLHELFNQNKVVLLKMNPVNDIVGGMLERALKPLVDGGFLRFAYGGPEVGAYLTDHAGIDTVHMTGSNRTHDAIVFGPGDEGEKRRSNGNARLKKPFTAELGNVSPVIVVPGNWSDKDIREQARNIAGQLVINAGFNCVTSRVLITKSDWAGREPLLEAIRAELKSAQARRAYYPGSKERLQGFADAYEQTEHFGDGDVPFALIPGVDAADTEAMAFRVEAFGPLMAETTLAADSVPDFLQAAVEFCNEHLWGSLSAMVVAKPSSVADSKTKAAFEKAIADLRYGTIGINAWTGLSFLLMNAAWGAFPGHAITDIQSGTGTVHNVDMFTHPEKSVLRGPFRPIFKSPHDPSHKTLHKLAPLVAKFEVDPSLLQLPAIALAAAMA